VRTLAVAIAGVCLLAPLRAHGETASELVTRGEQLAKEGRLSDAIDAFKQADRIEPKARHACLIALAYTRRELWPQAEIFLTLCHDRAGAGDPLPDWVPLADRQLAERLATAKVAEVEIRVEPGDLKAHVVVSSFAPDETFEPRTIHLNLGRHLITATADGREPVQETVQITDTSPRKVVIKFPAPKAARPDTEVVPPPQQPHPRQRSRVVPWTMIVTGLAIAAGGGAYHVLAFKPARDKLVDATDATPDPALYDRNSKDFDNKRNLTIALYGTGAAIALIGVVLRGTVYRTRPESSVRVSSQLVDGGAVVGLEWQR
jgi:hypothetical protein